MTPTTNAGAAVMLRWQGEQEMTMYMKNLSQRASIRFPAHISVIINEIAKERNTTFSNVCRSIVISSLLRAERKSSNANTLPYINHKL